jgi:hypothetical protein
MIPAGFVQALVTYATVKGSAGVAEINTQFDALFARVTATGGKTLISSAINGKNYGYQINTTTEELMGAFGEAIREINGDRVVCTRADFSALQR